MTDNGNHTVTLQVNGDQHVISCPPNELLSDTLRHRCGMMGVHVGCEQGVCGACTVMLDGHSVRSCLMLTVQTGGAAVTTVEALRSHGRLHPLQEAFRECGAFQCGFCTPGFLMSILELGDRSPNACRSELREQLSGNLCRCTGYAPILDAAERYLKSRQQTSLRHSTDPAATLSSASEGSS